MEIKTIDKSFYKELGKKIGLARNEKGYSLKYVSKLVGITSTALDNIELGSSKIKPTLYKDICGVLDISPNFKIEIKIG